MGVIMAMRVLRTKKGKYIIDTIGVGPDGCFTDKELSLDQRVDMLYLISDNCQGDRSHCPCDRGTTKKTLFLTMKL